MESVKSLIFMKEKKIFALNFTTNQENNDYQEDLNIFVQ